MPTKDQLKGAQAILASCLSSWPYTPPECLDDLYWRAVANVFNELDPEGKCVTRGPRVSGPDTDPRPVTPELRDAIYHGSYTDCWGPCKVALGPSVAGDQRYTIHLPTGDILVGARESSISFGMTMDEWVRQTSSGTLALASEP